MKTSISRSPVSLSLFPPLGPTLNRWAFALTAGALLCCVLSFYQATDAAPPTENQPFANAIQQRMDMIGELKAIHALMKEQNTLLKEQNELLRTIAKS